MEEPSGMDQEKAARIAAKRTQRLREKMPLFAEQVEAVTAEQVKKFFDQHRNLRSSAASSLPREMPSGKWCGRR